MSKWAQPPLNEQSAHNKCVQKLQHAAYSAIIKRHARPLRRYSCIGRLLVALYAVCCCFLDALAACRAAGCSLNYFFPYSIDEVTCMLSTNLNKGLNCQYA